MFHILFDDIRNLQGMDIIVRTSKAMFDFLDGFDTTGHFLYMDNDLGGMTEGKDVLATLLEYGQRPDHVYLVTSNTVAREYMKNDLLATGYVMGLDGLQFNWPQEA